MADDLLTYVAGTPRSGIAPIVIGASGLVGGAFYKRLRDAGYEALGTYHTSRTQGFLRHDLKDGLGALKRECEMHLVILASALTHVDYCETHPEEAHERNVEQVRKVVDWCREAGRPLVFFSSDYVFDGTEGPYAEDATPHPLSVYGRTKLAAEELVLGLERSLVIRVTNVFDIGFEGRNFVHRCVTHLRDNKPLVVPSDQFATPTYATWLADQCVRLYERGDVLRAGSPKLLHAGCDDFVSRGELARRVASLLGADASLVGERPTAELGQAAPRPLRGGLRNDRWKALLGVERLPLDDALDDCLPRMRRLYARPD